MAESKKKTWRLLNPDGSFNIEQPDLSVSRRGRDLYHRLLTWRWRKFIAALGLLYIGMNLLFALGYWALGSGAIVTSDLAKLSGGPGRRFIECFFFSVQTFATVGYGKMIPDGFWANLLMTLESFVGLLYVALVTGVIFARFSRPTARVVFSKKALIREEEGIPSLMFRLANLRANEIADAQISVTLARLERTAEGETYRNFHELKLESKRSPMFVLSWTVIHPIDSTSPLYRLKKEDLIEQEVEIIVVLIGWDETFSSTVHARYSYGPDDILWGYRYRDIIRRTDDQRLAIAIDRIHDVEPLESTT